MGKTKYPLCLICPALQGSHAFMSLHVSPGLPEVKLCTFEKNSTLSRAVGMSRAVWDPELLHEVTQRRVYQCQMRDLYLCPPPDPCSFIPRPQINSALLLWSFRLWLPSWGFLAWMQVIFNSWGLWLLSPESLVLTSQTCFRQPPVRDGGIGTEGGFKCHPVAWVWWGTGSHGGYWWWHILCAWGMDNSTGGSQLLWGYGSLWAQLSYFMTIWNI